jgi:hypothetical protein
MPTVVCIIQFHLDKIAEKDSIIQLESKIIWIKTGKTILQNA